MDLAFITVTGLCAAFGASALMSGISLPAKVSAVFFLAVPQLYFLPQGSADISVATVLVLLFMPGLVAAGYTAHNVLVRVFVSLLIVRLVAVMWSPDPRSGLQSVVLLGQLLATFLLMSRAAQEGVNVSRPLRYWYWPWVMLEAGLVIVFRVWPSIEDVFLRSIGSFFAGHNGVAGIFSADPNNILDQAKAGGLFLNANVGAMFLGVNALAAFAIASITQSGAVRLVGVIALTAVPFTGSKSATVLALALPAVAFIYYHVYRSTRMAARRYLLIMLASLGTVGIVALNSLDLPLLNDSQAALDTRTVIWGFGAEAFRQSPVLGLGYGGWDLGFPRYAADHGFFRSFPPHNLLINAWATTGLVGLGLTMAFITVLVGVVAHRLAEPASRDPRSIVYAGAAMSWILIQGMGENTDFFGEVHLVPIVALLLVHLVSPGGVEMRESGRTAYHRNSQTPVVPALGNVYRQSGAGVTAFSSLVRRARQSVAKNRNGLRQRLTIRTAGPAGVHAVP